MVLFADFTDLESGLLESLAHRFFGLTDQPVRDPDVFCTAGDIKDHRGAALDLGVGLGVSADHMVRRDLIMGLPLRIGHEPDVIELCDCLAARHILHGGHADQPIGVQQAGSHHSAASDDADDQQQQQDGPYPAPTTTGTLPVVGVVVINVRILRSPRGERGAHTCGGNHLVEAAGCRSHRSQFSGDALLHANAVQSVLYGVVELLGRLEAQRRILGERFGDHRLHGGGDPIVEVGDHRRVLAHMLVGHRNRRVPHERGAVGQQLEEHTAG